MTGSASYRQSRSRPHGENDHDGAPPGSATQASPAEGELALVATPIGNLGDITPRALEVLKGADAILCEDTRVTTRLLRHYGIDKPLVAFHDHNERAKTPLALERIARGERLALVSDAGTPVFSDPGYRLVQAAGQAGLKVVGIPGANAAVTALSLSGLPPAPFTFMGFPLRGTARLRAFEQLKALEGAGFSSTVAWYESPQRLVGTLSDLAAVFGPDRPAAVGRELTKLHEETVRGTLSTLKNHFEKTPPRGEIVLLMGPAEQAEAGAGDVDRLLADALSGTQSLKDAAAMVAEIAHLPKRAVYARALELQAARKAESDPTTTTQGQGGD
ncbi:16S rRNA (cytidine(1402)-2'-O)-methyltransferase [Formicincola oecophyllae]|uniref:Ribosomal RNA small subunit methyltransferase I n=1 Tax=Formicincola oecophyllae TaxID=2558361 RepID=A0A4Y6U953_9PROT|nr:16S rRNA (cytidine(1402)-2'-O)-methyltransferase [Formicincola oecophyllae]QDH12911.1 16S rRNA (cytidine(1402)-2'-O)-methyltransferase [Formicincola oecophyllae]